MRQSKLQLERNVSLPLQKSIERDQNNISNIFLQEHRFKQHRKQWVNFSRIFHSFFKWAMRVETIEPETQVPFAYNIPKSKLIK